MAKLSHADSRRMYSWWWDSHISPKNSKWLQENLTDMDAKVKAMIKLIEEDADSFARRAEMYYKKRPELMKLVEEFYRAYRALAERYDHATGVIQHAHKTMAEAFPNQVPMGFVDDSPVSSASGTDPQTPNSTPVRFLFESAELQKDYNSDTKKNGATSMDDSNSAAKGRGLKQINDLFGSGGDGKVRKGLNFHESEEKEQSSPGLDRGIESEESLRNSRISRAEEDSQGLIERASKAEAEVQTLKEALSKLETEKEANLQEYRRCLEKISGLEGSQEDTVVLNQRATKADLEAQSLKDDLVKIAIEKDKALDQYMRSLEMIAELENKLQHAEEDAKKLYERVERSESEVEGLKQAVSDLSQEKEAAALKLSSLQVETQRLERSNQTLQSTVESLTQKMGSQSQQLTEKQQEMGRLWARFVEAETAFQTLQHLHAQVQEELRSLTSELKNRVQLSRELETNNQRLHDEIVKVKEENKSLEELNVSSSMTIRNMQGEICSLSETKEKLEQEVELRLDQRNALQQEIYCLKEELNDLNKKHLSILNQVLAIGFDPKFLGSSVKELQDENTNLRGMFGKERSEKEALLEKLKLFDQLVEKNSVLENSLSDLSDELEAVRGKVKALECSCQSLLDEKETLTNELHVTNENLENLSAKNTVLENSLSDALDELQTLKETSKGLEDSCQILTNENADLLGEQERLLNQLQTALLRVENVEKMYADIEQRYSVLEKEKQAALGRIEELHISLDREKQDHACFIQMSNTQLADMESEMLLLREECGLRAKEIEVELDNALDSQIQIFILQKSAQDLEGKSFSLLTKYHKLLDASALSEKLVLNLEQRNLEWETEAKSLHDQASTLRKGMHKLLKDLDIVIDHHTGHDKIAEDEACLHLIQNRVEGIKESIFRTEEENQQQVFENFVLVTLLSELKSEADNLHLEKATIEREYTNKSNQFCMLQSEAVKMQDANEEMKSKIKEKDHKEKLLEDQIANLGSRLMNLQEAYDDLQKENHELHEEKTSMANEISVLEERSSSLEEENYAICGEILSLESLSMVIKNCVYEKSLELKMLAADLDKLNEINSERGEKLVLAERMLEELKLENLNLMMALKRSEDELNTTRLVKNQLDHDIEIKNNSLLEKDHQILEIAQKLSLIENEKVELHQNWKNLIREHTEAKRNTEDLENQIISLSKESNCLRTENGSLHEAGQLLEDRLLNTCEENRRMKEQNEVLHSQLQNQITEIHTLESEMEELYGELQNSTFCHGLYEQKVHELMRASESFEAEITSKDIDINLLKGRVNTLDADNEGLKTKLATWESEGEELFGELQNSTFCVGLYEQKVHELIRVSESFEAENTSKDIKIELLNKRVNILDSDNECLKTQLATLESKGEELFGELQNSTFILDFYEQKVYELMKVSDSFENEIASKDIDIELLKERVNTLDADNEGLKIQLATWESEAEKLFGKFQISTISHGLYDQKVYELMKVSQSFQAEITILKERLSILDAENECCKDQLATWESKGEDLFGELQISTISHELYEQKIHELTRVTKSFEAESASKDIDIKLLKERVSIVDAENEGCKTQLATWESELEKLFGELLISMFLHGLYEQKVRELMKLSKTFKAEISSNDVNMKLLNAENQELKTQLAACGPAIASLIQCISSLEKHTYGKLQNPQNDVAEVIEAAKHPNLGTDAFADLQDLATRIQAVEKILLEVEQLAVEDNLSLNAKLQAAMNQIEELKTESSTLGKNSEIIEAENGILTKDIMLDQISECSPYDRTKRETLEADNQILELWETTNTDGDIDGEDTSDFPRFEPMKMTKNEHPGSDSLSEKELGVDKLEYSKREGNKKKVLERLNSDMLKLTNLQIAVEGLKRKLEITENSRRGKAVLECESLKGQLNEAEAAIQKLFDQSDQVMKIFKTGSFSSDIGRLEENESMSRRRISEQAQRISEKIGRLQLEIEKMQFVVLKQEGGKGKSRMSEAKRTVLLRDYLYGGGVRQSHKPKKKPFCSCIEPPTKED